MEKSKEEQSVIFDTHRPYIKEYTHMRHTDLRDGMVVRFEYKGKLRYVYVLNANFHDKMHGLDLHQVKRHDLLPLVRALPVYTEKQLYDHYLKSEHMKKVDAYRTYKLINVHQLQLVQYDVPKGVL